jgi:hypothetical protein
MQQNTQMLAHFLNRYKLWLEGFVRADFSFSSCELFALPTLLVEAGVAQSM